MRAGDENPVIGQDGWDKAHAQGLEKRVEGFAHLRVESNEHPAAAADVAATFDGMFAPVVSRLCSYSIDVDPVSRAYMDAVRATAGWRDWLAGAKAEPWHPPQQDAETLVKDLRASA